MTFHIIDGEHWWALRTRSNFERTVARQLEALRLEAFLPTYRAVSKRKDRRVVNTLPLFSGYVFVKADLTDVDTRVNVYRVRGVVSVVGGSQGPIPVRCSEIDSIALLCKSQRMLEPWARLEVGKTIRIVRGGLAGVSGVLVEVGGQGKRIICNVELLGRAVAAQLQPDDIELCDSV